jgi:FAS-associated factor 2
VRLLSSPDVAVWGGDVRARDAWAASAKLGAATYPTVAFVALQPRRTGGGAPALAVLSRHAGAAACAPAALKAHLEDALLPRVRPFLQKIRAERAGHTRERELRADQERAFADAAAKDAARIHARMAQEKADAAAALAAEHAAVESARAASLAEAAAEEKEASRTAWRRYARRALVPAEARVNGGRGATRVVLRLPGGERVVRVFPPGTDAAALYAFAAAALLPASLPASTDPSAPPAEGGLEQAVQDAGGPDAFWGFRLASAFPRRAVGYAPGARLDALDGVRGGAQLVVELVDEDKPAAAVGSDDDGYHTESD